MSFAVVANIGTGFAVSLVAPTPPVITLQPTNQTVAAGATATFTVAYTGPTPITGQWQVLRT